MSIACYKGKHGNTYNAIEMYVFVKRKNGVAPEMNKNHENDGHPLDAKRGVFVYGKGFLQERDKLLRLVMHVAFYVS